jgi:hypothetical protein
MRYDPDWDEADQGFDDGEAFSNSLIDVGQLIIHFLFDNRSRYWPTLDDRAFLPILDMVRQVLDHILFPEHLAELWDYACMIYQEDRRESTPRITFKKCEQDMQELLPEWYKVVAEARGDKRDITKRRKKRK